MIAGNCSTRCCYFEEVRTQHSRCLAHTLEVCRHLRGQKQWQQTTPYKIQRNPSEFMSLELRRQGIIHRLSPAWLAFFNESPATRWEAGRRSFKLKDVSQMKQMLKQVLPCFTDQEPHLSRQRKAESAMSRCQRPATPKRQPAQRCGGNMEDMGAAWDFRDQELRLELLRAGFDLCGTYVDLCGTWIQWGVGMISELWWTWIGLGVHFGKVALHAVLRKPMILGENRNDIPYPVELEKHACWHIKRAIIDYLFLCKWSM